MILRKKIEKTKEISKEEIINKGAPVLSDMEDKPKWTSISLRITSQMISEIDAILRDRIGISRNGWILEAIQEKLKTK